MTPPYPKIERKETPTPSPNLQDYPSIAFLIAALLFLPVGGDTETLDALAVVFISIVLEAIPFMFVGSLVGGFVEAFVSRERMVALLPRRGWLTTVLAAGAGILFPVCECAVVPVVRRLVGKGLPLSAAVGYLLGGPIVNPIVAASTALAYAFDWRVVALRLLLGFGIAVAIGLLMGRRFRDETAFIGGMEGTDTPAPACGCGHHHAGHHIHSPAGASDGCAHGRDHAAPGGGLLDGVGAAFRHAADDFMAVGHYLVIGAFIAALGQTYIERAAYLEMAEIPGLSIVLMMALAVLLNLCSEADAFIAASFRGLMPLSAQTAFMLTGPMFDLKLLLMYQALFRRKAIAALAGLILAVVLAVCVGLEALTGIFGGFLGNAGMGVKGGFAP